MGIGTLAGGRRQRGGSVGPALEVESRGERRELISEPRCPMAQRRPLVPRMLLIGPVTVRSSLAGTVRWHLGPAGACAVPLGAVYGAGPPYLMVIKRPGRCGSVPLKEADVNRGSDGIPRRLVLAFILMGFVATAAQVLLLRRLMSVLYGNEMVVGVTLAVWMTGTAAGSLGAARVSKHRARLPLLTATLSAIVLVPITILGTYGIRAILGIPAAQVLSPGASLLTCALLLLPLTALLGSLFVFFTIVDRRGHEERIGAVYLFEALGAAAGGLGCSLAASWNLAPFAWSFGVGMGLCAIVWLTTPRGVKWKLAAAATVVLTALLTWGPGRFLPSIAQSLAWPEYHLIQTVESRYASVAVAESGGQRTLFVDALPDFTVPDSRSAEETMHSALLQHPDPRRVLLIGGGLTQAAKEAFKHGVEHLDYVQLDPVITQLEREYLSVEGETVFRDPRVSVHNVDGRFFVGRGEDLPYEVIVVNAPDPATALINRLYTVEFFTMVKKLLEPRGGVLAFGCGEMANYVSRSLGRLLACQAGTLGEVFEHKLMLPLGRIHFIASDNPQWLTDDGAVLAHRLEERGIETSFMREYYLSYDLSPQRVEYLASEVARAQADDPPKANKDRNPVGYFYYLAYWYRLLGSRLAGVLEAPWARHGSLAVPIAAALAFAMTALPGLLRRRGAARSAAVATMGFVTLTSQVVLLLALQTFQGYLFHSVGLVVAAFMVGLSLGALWVRRRPAPMTAGVSRGSPASSTEELVLLGGKIVLPQGALAGYCIILAAAFYLPLDRLPELTFTALAVIVSMAGGLLGGSVFQIAAAATLSEEHSSGSKSRGVAGLEQPSRGRPAGSERVAMTAGVLNACDHLGAALGALAAASIMLPALGLSGSAAVGAAAAAGSAFGLALAKL